jgi:hypothetical protein
VRRLLACLALVLSSFPAVSRAAVVVALDLRELTRQAHVVAEVRVTDEHSRRLPSGQIITELDAVVLEGIKGVEDGEDLAFFTEGGVVDGVGARVEGEPRVHAGDHLVVFLEEAGAGLRFVGMSQGCFAVREAATGPAVLPAGSGLALVRRTPLGLRPAPPALSTPRPLSSFLDEVRALAPAR